MHRVTIAKLMEAFPQLNDHTEFELVVDGTPYHAEGLVWRTLDNGEEVLGLALSQCPNPASCEE